MTDDMIGWHPQLDGREFEQALGVGDGQGSLECCSPWGHKESDVTEEMNRSKESLHSLPHQFFIIPIFQMRKLRCREC